MLLDTSVVGVVIESVKLHRRVVDDRWSHPLGDREGDCVRDLRGDVVKGECGDEADNSLGHSERGRGKTGMVKNIAIR